jgi:SAM-dependent methyltransferase
MKKSRSEKLLDGLNTDGVGLEVSPLFRPIAVKSKYNVYYTDYCSAEESREKHANYDHDPIMDIDFIWKPGERLFDCVPNGMMFDWAISSHVMEHVPDPIGWMTEIFQVLKPGAIFSVTLPDKNYCFDKFRRNTDVADLIDLWVRKQKIPSPRQLYDFLSRSFNDTAEDGVHVHDTAKNFEDCPRTYTDEQALDFVKISWENNQYFDAHCSVFTADSFIEVFEKLNELGILNISLSEPIVRDGEFTVKLVKLGEPKVKSIEPNVQSIEPEVRSNYHKLKNKIKEFIFRNREGS